MKRETLTKIPRKKPLQYQRKKAPPREKAVPLQPLSDEQRRALIGFEHGAAEIHLKEAIDLLAWGGAPNACIHSAYYGIYHAATAVLHIAGGVGKAKHVPKSHEHVLEHFTKLAETLGGDAMDAAKMLNRTRSARVTADYGGAEPPYEHEVQEAVENARRFVEICVQHLKLPPLNLPAPGSGRRSNRE